MATCKGRDQFDLAHIDVTTDPTLKPGAVVATSKGMVALTGRQNQTAQFTPARGQAAAMPIMPPNPGAPKEAAVKLPLVSAQT